MKMLTWTLGILAAYAATVYVLQKPKTWARIALVSERISLGAREAHTMLKRQEQETRAQSWEEMARQRPFPKIGPGPDRKPIGNDDVMDAVRFAISWLKDQQRRR